MQRKLAFVAVKVANSVCGKIAVHRSRVGPQRPENDPVDHNPDLRSAQANSEGGPAGPGSAKLALRCALRTAENTGISRKMSELIFRKIPVFSCARELSWRCSSNRRKLFVFFFKPVRPDGSRGRSPLVQELEG